MLAINGRLTRDMDLTYTQQGSAVGKFSIAVNSARKGQDGKFEDEADFFDCSFFGKSAEGIKRYLVKGQQVSISGKIRQSRWKDKEGHSRSAVYIQVDTLQLMGGSRNTSGNETHGSMTETNAGSRFQGDYISDMEDKEIPF